MAATAITTINGSLHPILNPTTHLRHNNHSYINRHPILSLPLPPLKQPQNLKLHYSKPLIFSSLNPNFPQKPPFLTNSTKTLTTLFALSLSLSSKIAQFITTQFSELKTLISTPSLQHLQTLHFLQDNVVPTVGPLFFASLKESPSGSLKTPLAVAVAAGMARWLDIYSGVLMVRVLLSWFPNMPWDIQPLSAIRDLCDPFLNLFRDIIPPVFGTIDVSPLLAFAVLGTLGSILHSPGVLR
ncbi:YlmG-like protein 1-2 chloroplastic [Bienertia sinuspersici]